MIMIRKGCQRAIMAAAVVLLMSFLGHAGELENGDLFIPAEEVTETAKFYPINVDGTNIEIFAVRALDGTIRTAFNTCQVCYGSGRGYYKQQGNFLVCQNCGNRFGTSDIEVVHGGCNPVPITEKYKTTDEKGVTIPREFLVRAKAIFTNWKR
ncbi:MAG: DUF2318 domain-containing protein [Synergistaceae bacterium]|jgi:uncharacterized membrane protein|nr:DUF2318 domain-containing protein [Synergistaceae bacterium]